MALSWIELFSLMNLHVLVLFSLWRLWNISSSFNFLFLNLQTSLWINLTEYLQLREWKQKFISLRWFKKKSLESETRKMSLRFSFLDEGMRRFPCDFFWDSFSNSINCFFVRAILWIVCVLFFHDTELAISSLLLTHRDCAQGRELQLACG